MERWGHRSAGDTPLPSFNKEGGFSLGWECLEVEQHTACRASAGPNFAERFSALTTLWFSGNTPPRDVGGTPCKTESTTELALKSVQQSQGCDAGRALVRQIPQLRRANCTW